MKNLLTKLVCIFAIAVLFTGCPKSTGANEVTDGSLTERIDAAQTSIDFEGAEIAENAVVAKKITVKNLKLGGKTLTIEASGTELQNVSNAVIVIDQKVGDGDVTLTGCTNINKLVVNGGGSNSIHIKNSKVANVEVKKDAVRVAMEGTSEVEALVVDAAATKIESEESIVIKAITVNENVDKVTVKGGTVEKIEVAAPQGSQTAAQIVVDGKADIQSIEGTKDVQLTKEAIQSGSNVVVKAPVPVVTYYDNTIVFLSNGDLTGTEFENEDVFYEYVFNFETDNQEMQALGAKLKLYKLENSIELYLYTAQTHPQFPDIHSQKYSESNTNSIAIEDLYDSTLVLSSAGIVKGEFSAAIADSPTASYSQKFDISSCGMPAIIVLPEDPAKPLVTVTATEQGNKIHVSNSHRFYGRIEIFAAEKDENNEWKPSKTKVFALDGYNYENPPAYTSLDFLDSYVNDGKEYAYYVDTSDYRETNKYEYSNTNLYHAVTATGGKGEIVIQAEATDQGIKITVPEIETTDKFSFFDTLLRGNYNSDYTSINNLNKLKGEPVIDYFVKAGTEYTYTLESHFYYFAEQYTYYPHSNKCTVAATGGLGEAVITNSPAAVQNGQAVNFTTPPVLGISSISDDFEIQISFSYSVQTGENSSSGQSFCIDYDYAPTSTTVKGNLNSWFNQGPYGTYNSNNSYEVYIKYPYESDDPFDTTGITYQNFVHNTNFSSMPSSITITQE
ncbi:MAG: hypothetical protein J5710_07985 [Treponema sp.]|nr:hypothetical protein [Treponema sp.]